MGYQGAGVSANAPGTSQLPDPKDKIEEQNLLHSAMIASDDNRTDQARQALEKVLQLDPKSPTALRQLGELELHAVDYARAAEHLKLAREVRPQDSTAAFYEGQARLGTVARRRHCDVRLAVRRPAGFAGAGLGARRALELSSALPLGPAITSWIRIERRGGGQQRTGARGNNKNSFIVR